MSIWSSFASIDGLYEGGYGDDELAESTLDLASTGLREHGDRIRLWINGEGRDEATVVLRRHQVIALRDALNDWLDE